MKPTPPMSSDSLDSLCINTIRTLSIDAIQKANSGHPGLPLGAAPMAHVLWDRFLKHDPKRPDWADRDRFVLSAGHGSMLLYSLLHLYGYDLSLDEIKAFRQWGSKTPGHPEFGLTPGVEATTGPLGQGSVNAIGMAMAERSLAHLFNRPGFEIVNHYTYALVSDGDLMEGISAEGASLAGHLKLGKLIYLYDANDVTLDGPTSLTFSTENVARRYESYDWHVQTVKDGDRDLKALHQAIENARQDTTKPSLIIIKTTIGFGSPNKAGKSSVHGSPLGPEELVKTKETLGWDPKREFYVPEETRAHYRAKAEEGARASAQWDGLFARYRAEFPELAKQWDLAQSGALPTNWDQSLKPHPVTESSATREASGATLNAVAPAIPWLIGGDADLGCSTNTVLKGAGSFEGQGGSGRNIHFGVREHAMAAIANGMCYHGGIRPFVATFFCFFDYMKPSVRLAAMNHLAPIYVWTHDSIGLGEDGPTHQPIEHLMALRAVPNVLVLRPCDANETQAAWKIALQEKKTPVALVLTRQKVATLDRAKYGDAALTAKGAYVLSEASGGKPKAILIATGSEVHAALEAQTQLEKAGTPVRVVSMPSWELFQRQTPQYRESVLPKAIRARVSVEAGVTLGWERWVGDAGVAIGIDRYGASAPLKALLENYGLTAGHIVKTVQNILSPV